MILAVNLTDKEIFPMWYLKIITTLQKQLKGELTDNFVYGFVHEYSIYNIIFV